MAAERRLDGRSRRDGLHDTATLRTLASRGKDFVGSAACLDRHGSIELRHLRYLIAVAEAGSVTAAAERTLHTSQPSLSRQIRDLEDRVGAVLLTRSARGVEPTAAGHAFIEHARTALAQIDAAVEAARRAAAPAKERLAIGFLTGEEMTWLPPAMRLLRADLPTLDVVITSDDSPDLADAVQRGRLDVAFLRAEPAHDLVYRVVDREPLVVLMPIDHRLVARRSIRPRDLVGEPFLGMGGKARVLRTAVDAYLRRARVAIEPAQQVDNPAMVMSLITATRGVALVPAYVRHLMPESVTSRPLAAPVPTIDLVVGYRAANQSPALALFLVHLDDLAAAASAAPREPGHRGKR